MRWLIRTVVWLLTLLMLTWGCARHVVVRYEPATKRAPNVLKDFGDKYCFQGPTPTVPLMGTYTCI